MTERITNMADGNTNPESGTPPAGDASQPNLGRRIGDFLNRAADRLERYAEVQPNADRSNPQPAGPGETQQPGPEAQNQARPQSEPQAEHQTYNPNRPPTRDPNIAIPLEGKVELNKQRTVPDWWPYADEEGKKIWDNLLDEKGVKGRKEGKDRTIQGAVLAMRHYYELPNAERAAKADKFAAAYKVFAEYALGQKLYDGKDSRIIAVELELVSFDQRGIDAYKHDPERQRQVIDLLNRIDFLEGEQIGNIKGRETLGISEQNVVDDRFRPPEVPKTEWETKLKKELELNLKRRDQIQQELVVAEQSLGSISSFSFLDRRKILKTKINNEIKEIKKKIKDENETAHVTPEPWEKSLEDKSWEGIDILLEPDNPYAAKSLTEITNFIKAENEKSSGEQNKDLLAQAEKALEWNFQQARKLGIFDDLDERLDGKYQELMLSLFSNTRGDQNDPEVGTGRVPRKLTFDEVKEIIAKDTDEIYRDALVNTADSETAWRYLVRDGVISRNQADHFKSIRKVFVARAYEQMYDTLSNRHNLNERSKAQKEMAKLKEDLDRGIIDQEDYDRGLRKRIRKLNFQERTIQRLSGEWDVRKQDREVSDRLEAEERAERDKLFYVDRYYLTLTGTTKEQIEQGVNNYLTSLLEGAHVHDVQTIIQKMQYLSSAIMSKKDVLIHAGMSGKDAQEALTKINLHAENRGDIYVMDFAAQNLLMDEYFIPLYDKWGGVAGIDKLKAILDMNKGLISPAMLLILAKKNGLLFQPAGFKGQGMNNIWAQRTLRGPGGVIRTQIAKELVNFQSKEVSAPELMEQTNWQDFLRIKSTQRTFEFNGAQYKPEEAVRLARDAYDALLKEIRGKYVDNDTNKLRQNISANNVEINNDLERLRKARGSYDKLNREYDRLLEEAKSTVDTTMRIFNVFGETAFLGAPVLIMDNGDHINIEDATYFHKLAILEAIKDHGPSYNKAYKDRYGVNVNESLATIRWRAYQWAKNPWQYDQAGNPIVKGKIKNANGVDVEVVFGLVKGYETTGLTQQEFNAFLKAAKELRTNGFNAVLKKDANGNPLPGYTFEEVVDRNDVRPVRNNFIGNYKSSRDIFTNPTAMREAKKGRQDFIMKILERLNLSGRGRFTDLDYAKIDGKPIDKVAPERLKEIFEDATTDSLIFQNMVRKLTRIDATHNLTTNSQGNLEYSKEFSTDRLFYGGNEFPWGVKRLQYLIEYWMTNKRERVGRAWRLLPLAPLLKVGLAKDCDAENLPDLIFNLNKEHIDEPGLKQIAAGYKDAQGWRHRGETSVDEQRGETIWAWWDKPSVDIAQVLKVVPDLPVNSDGKHLGMGDYIKDPKLFISNPLYDNYKKRLVDETRDILKREAPMSVFLEAQLGYNRSAGGSGIGLEEGEKWHLEVLEWWLEGENKLGRGLEGGLKVNEDVEIFLKFITKKGSWSPGVSIVDEAWRQSRGTRDAGASDRYPQPVIIA